MQFRNLLLIYINLIAVLVIFKHNLKMTEKNDRQRQDLMQSDVSDCMSRMELATLLINSDFATQCTNATFTGIWKELVELKKVDDNKELKQKIIDNVLPTYIAKLKNEHIKQVSDKILSELSNTVVTTLLQEHKNYLSISVYSSEYELLHASYSKHYKSIKDVIIKLAAEDATPMVKEIAETLIEL
jgi:hypothetical protein